MTKEVSKYMTTLSETMTAKGLSAGSVKMYLIKLRLLNGNKAFTSLTFLKDNKKIKMELDKIENENTRKSYIASIVSVLNNTDNKTYKTVKTYYKALLEDTKMDKKDDSEKYKDMMEWNDVLDKYKEMTDDLDKSPKKLTDHLILSFYVLMPPRRNDDYYLMKLDTDKKTDEAFNYYRPKTSEFIFNQYKTKKTYGTDSITINSQLKKVIDNYVKEMELKDDDFLLKRSASNMITKTLNRIFKNNVGASMLRHIYLTSKYGDVKEEMQKDADMMAHSTTMQKDYIKDSATKNEN